jgi:hypothetical protein
MKHIALALALTLWGLTTMPNPTTPTASQTTTPAGYDVARTAASHAALLGADDAAWKAAAAIGWGEARYHTRFRAVWTERAVYVRFDATDPNPWHTMTTKDAHLWEEEVVELFLDPAHQGFNYFELEINPANVVCDVRMLSAYPNVKSDLEWDHEGLETRVTPLRDAAGAAVGWTATAFIPWNGFRSLPVPERIALPPKVGDVWRFNAYRIKRPGGPSNPKDGALFAAWSPTGTPSFHTPPAFRNFTFR